jgi:hypothetical protein
MMRGHRTLVVCAVAAAALAAGCTKHQTEMILVITTEGVRIPDDVHKVHLTVADRQPAGDDPVYDADIELCNPMLSTGCYDIPLTAALYPGKSRGGDSVRVQVDAVGPSGTVIADAALFTFADEQSLRLDFVLYANCLGNVECALRNQACGPSDTCIDLKPGQTNGPLDLALPPAPDLAACGQLNQACCPTPAAPRPRPRWKSNVLPELGTTTDDMATPPPDMDMAMSLPDLTMVPPDLTMVPPDLSQPPFPMDLSTPPNDLAAPPDDLATLPTDLATSPPADLATGPGGVCNPGLRCVAGSCVP